MTDDVMKGLTQTITLGPAELNVYKAALERIEGNVPVGSFTDEAIPYVDGEVVE